jgi:precorrin-2 dehydrogenase/sirohydrochlorin ferrochelatase
MSELTTNTLYPVFFKLSNLKMLIVGAGEVAQEKLHFILKSSPDAQITVIAPEIAPEIVALFNSSSFHINIINKEFYEEVLESFDLVVAATNIKSLNQKVYEASKQRKILINVADTPARCDF